MRANFSLRSALVLSVANQKSSLVLVSGAGAPRSATALTHQASAIYEAWQMTRLSAAEKTSSERPSLASRVLPPRLSNSAKTHFV